MTASKTFLIFIYLVFRLLYQYQPLDGKVGMTAAMSVFNFAPERIGISESERQSFQNRNTHMKKAATFKTILTGFAGLAVFGGLVATASAGTLDIARTAGYYADNGGEFTIHLDDINVLGSYGANAKNPPVIGALGNSFESFCLEYTESFPGFPVNDLAYSINPNGWAISGGAGGSGGHDEICIGTAELYSLFATGSWGLYDYTAGPGRVGSARSLQLAIWYLEGERTFAEAGGNTNTFLNYLAGGPATEAALLLKKSTDSDLAFGVTVLNLGSSPGFPYQDQLVMYTPPPSVPDGGATLMLMGLAMGGVSFLRRKLA
jgi:hypothetical protein